MVNEAALSTAPVDELTASKFKPVKKFVPAITTVVAVLGNIVPGVHDVIVGKPVTI